MTISSVKSMQHVIMKLALINVSKHIRNQVIKIEAQN